MDQPLFLAHGSGNGLGYTTFPPRALPSDVPGLVDDDILSAQAERVRSASNLRDEPECIGPAIVDGYASVATFHRSQQHALHVAEAMLIRPTLPPESRLSDLRRRAKASNVDLSHTLHILEREVRKARMREQPVPARVLDQMERLEGTLDGIAA